jgi:N-acetylglucosaminylphosphatidylinositol deacetylase
MTLSTINILRKYTAWGEIYNCGYDKYHYIALTPFTSYRAMMLHHSQFVWYRKLFSIFSSYAYCNSFELYAQNPEKYKQKHT